MPVRFKRISALLILTVSIEGLAQGSRPSPPSALAGLTCDSQTMVRLQNYVLTTEKTPAGEAKRTFEVRKTANGEYRLVLHFSKNDPEILKTVQAQLTEFRSACQTDLLNRSIRNIDTPSLVTPENLGGALPLLKVEVPELKKSGSLSLNLNPERTAAGKNRDSDTLSTEIVIDKNEYQRILEQSSLPLRGMGVRLRFDL